MKKFLNKISSFKQTNFILPITLFISFMGLALILLNLPLKDIASRMLYHIDAYLVSWIWSWEAHILTTQPWQLFETNIFAPFQHTLAFSETMLGSFLLAWPVLLISGNNAALTYNIVMLLTYAIAGLGMYQLVFYLTRNKLAALISAIIYAFAPFKLVHNGHLHLSGMWLPYVFLYLDKFFNQFRWSDGLKLAVFTILVFFTSLHYVIFLPLAGLIFLLVMRRQINFNKNKLIKTVLIILIIALITLPFIVPYWQVHQEYGQFRDTEINKKYAPTLIDYFVSPLFYNLYNQRQHIEMVVSPGLLVWLLFILAVAWLWFKKNTMTPYVKKIIIFYLSLGGLAFLISFGFYWRLTPNSHNYWPGLFSVLYVYWPGFNGIRATGRYSVFLLLALAVVIGMAVDLFFKKYARLTNQRIAISFALISLLLLEFAFAPAAIYVRPSLDNNEQGLIKWLKQQPTNKIFLELPMGLGPQDINYDIYYVFASRWHFRKIVNGYSGYYPPGYLQLARSSKFFKAQQIMPWLKKFKVNYLIFHFARYQPTEKTYLMQNLQQNDKIKYITKFGENYVYQVIYD